MNSSSTSMPPPLEPKSQIIPPPVVVSASSISGQSESRSKENIKLPEPKTNNFINTMISKPAVGEDLSR